MITVKRLVLTGILIFVQPPGSAFQLSLGVMFTEIPVLLQAMYRPYKARGYFDLNALALVEEVSVETLLLITSSPLVSLDPSVCSHVHRCGGLIERVSI